MNFPTNRLYPSRRGCLIACAFSCVLTAYASPAPSALNTLLKDSPFIPPGWHVTPTLSSSPQLPSVPLTLELHGYSVVGNNLMVSLYDVRDHTSFWVTPNDPQHPDVRIVSLDLTNNTVELNDRGRDVQLVLQPPSTQPMAVPPPTPPLVVYSPFYAGDRGGAAQNVASPAPVVAPAAASSPSPLRGQYNNRGNLAGQSGAYGRGAVANNASPGGAGVLTNNPATTNSSTGLGGGGVAPRRQIQQPTG